MQTQGLANVHSFDGYFVFQVVSMCPAALLLLCKSGPAERDLGIMYLPTDSGQQMREYKVFLVRPQIIKKKKKFPGG